MEISLTKQTAGQTNALTQTRRCPDVPHTRRRPQTKVKTFYAQTTATDDAGNVRRADESGTKFKTFYTQTTATDDAGNVRRADDSHRRRCKRWRWYRRLATLTRCPFKKQQYSITSTVHNAIVGSSNGPWPWPWPWIGSRSHQHTQYM